MAGEWFEQCTFADLISDGALEIGDGYRAKNEELGGEGLIFLRAGHMTDTHIDFDGVERFHADLEPRVRSKLAKPGDAIVTTKGNSTGRTAFVSPSMPPFVYSPHLSYWRSLDPSRIAGGFLRYWCKGPEFATQLAGMKASTDMAPYLSLVDQKRLQITLPPAGVQRAIAHILGTLDDKIDLNRQTNETLEAMARALFKSWFVAFDPVRAKAEGRDPNLPKPLVDLFPDSFEDSELGDIPKGWDSVELASLIDFVKGRRPTEATSDAGEGLSPVILIEGFDGTVSTYAQATGMVEATTDDVLMVMDGASSGRVETGCAGIVGSTLAKIRPRGAFPGKRFLYFFLKHLEPETRGHLTGTSIPHADKGWIARQCICLPKTPELLRRYECLATAVRSRVDTNRGQSRTLAALRDTLLPRLISGKLRVKDAKRVMGEVV